jgi:uroporphyrinogen decarboxylase
MAWLPPTHVAAIEVLDEGEYWAMYDRWGAKRRMPKAGGLYYDLAEFPIKECTLAELEAYHWPEPDPPEYFATLGEEAKRLYETTDYLVVGNGFDSGNLFGQPWEIVGLENFLMAMAVDRPFCERLMDGVLEIYLEWVDRYLDAVGEYIDVVAFGDDVSGQDGWLFSPELFVSLVKPRYRRLFDAVRSRTKAKIMFHSCGAVYDLIPHLIDLGVDILNPVQVSARGMDTRRLKAAYGRDITFWGGGVDTQHVLPFGAPQQVRDEVRRRIDDLAPGGGFVFSAVHNIQAFVPPENIVAAFDEAFEYGRYAPAAGA